MGKQKKEKRAKTHRSEPTGIPSMSEFDEMEADLNESDSDKVMQKILEELQSVNIEEKLSGLQSLESICNDSTVAVSVSREKIGKIVGPLLVDHNTVVRAAGASALHRIAESGGEEAYENLVKDDIMTPLSVLLTKYYNDWKPKEADAKNKREADDEKETLIQAVTLLWSLSENSGCIVKYSNQENLIVILLKLLDYKSYGMKLSTVAAQCMLTLSEDNPDATKELKNNEATLQSLMGISGELVDTVLLKTLAAGLLMNANSLFGNHEGERTRALCKITSVLAEALEIDQFKLVGDLAQHLQYEEDGPSRISKKKLDQCKNVIDAQRQALEILANICSDDQESEVDSEIDDSEGDQDVIYDDPMNQSDKSSDFETTLLPVELIEAITCHNIFEKVWQKTIALDDSNRQILLNNNHSKSISRSFNILRYRAFLCINNLTSCLDSSTLGGAEHLYRIWVQIGKVVFGEADPNDIELLESATSAMRAILEKLAALKANSFPQLSVDDIQPMLNGEKQCTNPNVKVNLIRILGNLALIVINFITEQRNDELIKNISKFLLDTSGKETEVWVMCEALDAVMDIFAEDETDSLARDIQLVQKLEPLVPVLSNKIRQQRKNLGENASIVSTVKANLPRFIKYKSKRVAKLR